MMKLFQGHSRWLPVLAAGLAGLVLLGGCSAGGAPASYPEAAPSAYPDNGGEAGGGIPEAPVVPSDRKIARSAILALQVADIDKASAELRRVATLVGGMVTSESLQLSTDDGFGSSELVVTVPSARLDETLTLIAGLGKVTQRTVESVDVTDTVVDVDSRVKTLRESIARLQELMKRAGSVDDIAQVESELTSRQSELEAMLARQQALAHQVATSPVTVLLATEAAVEERPRPGGFLAGLETGWSGLVAAAEAGLTVVGVLLPWLLPTAVVGLPLWWWGRRRRRGPQRPPRVGGGDSREP